MEPIRLHRAPTLAQLRKNGGFTLVEMLVVLGIITIIMAVVITSQSSFNKSLILANTAYDVALTIRSAETYGTGSRAQINNAGSITTNAGYGVYFDLTSTTLQKQITLFLDTQGSGCHSSVIGSMAPDYQPGDCIYQRDTGTSATDKAVNVYALGNGIYVSKFCLLNGSTWTCSDAGVLKRFNIVFTRPNPTPFIRSYDAPGTAYSQACIVLSSPQGTSRYISVSAASAINANASSCP